MSTFTITVDELIEADFDFGLQDYPIFDATYRAGLNQKILDHYRMYEIGQETDGLFKFTLNRRMNEIMPYYNKLYESERIEYDPLSTMDFTDISTTDNNTTLTTENTSTNSSTSDSRSRAVNSELPQVRLSPDEDYASSAADSVGHSETTGSGGVNASETGEATGTVNRALKGSQGHAPQLIMQYRAALLNIDLMVIADLSPCFMGIWDNGDAFSSTGRFYW